MTPQIFIIIEKQGTIIEKKLDKRKKIDLKKWSRIEQKIKKCLESKKLFSSCKRNNYE